MEVRGRRGRAEEEEGGRSYRRHRATVPNLEGEAGAIVYIWFSGFAREEGEEEEKREKPTRSTRIGHRRESASSNLERRTEDPTARNIWSDVDRASCLGTDAICSIEIVSIPSLHLLFVYS
jgi:hypothetical protein